MAWERPRGEGSAAYQADEVFDIRLQRRTEISRTLGFFGWFIGAAVAIWLLGMVIALPLFMLLYTLIEGRGKWRISLVMSAGAFLLIWGLFEYALEIRWPSGLFFQ